MEKVTYVFDSSSALRCTVWVAGILFMFSFAAFAQTEEQLLSKANAQYQDENYGAALENFLKYDSIRPGVADVSYKIGISYLNSSYKSKSLPYFKVVGQKVKNPKAYDLDFYLGSAYHFSHQFDSAIYYYERFKENFSGKPKKYADVIQVIDKEIESARNGLALQGKETYLKITSLGGEINGPWSDYAPLISSDEGIMLFTSRREGNMGNKIHNETGEYTEDIYYSNKDPESGEWGAAQPLAVVNTTGQDATIALSSDGRELLIYRSTSPQGDIYQSFNEDGNWTVPRKISKEVNSRFWEPSASFSHDGQHLYFSSDRPGGYGGLDLYVADKLENGEWGNVRNLGTSVNTPYDEDGPYMLSDNKTLFFSSRGHSTIGGYDIFKAKMQGEPTEWSSPENMGMPINTADDDMYLVWSADAKRAYYSSTREDDTYGRIDLYQVTLDKPVIPVNLLSKKIMTEDNQSVAKDATVTIIDPETKDTLGVYKPNPITGNISVAVPEDKEYDMVVSSPGYMPYYDKVAVEKDNTSSIASNTSRSAGQTTTNSSTSSGSSKMATTTPADETVYATGETSNDKKTNNYKSTDGSGVIESTSYTDDYSSTDDGSDNMVTESYVAPSGPDDSNDLNNSSPSSAPAYTKTSPAVNTPPATVAMKTLTKGNEIALNSVYFDFAKATLTSQSETQLNMLKKVLNENPSMKIKIIGHTDQTGSSSANKRLSKMRAKAVETYLEQNGVSKSRVKAIGMGESQATGNDEMDRRVEFKILKIDEEAVADAAEEALEAGKITARAAEDDYDYATATFNQGDVLEPKVHFLKKNSNYITDFSKERLEKLIEILKANPSMKIQIIAHSDMMGDYADNEAATLERAKTVKTYLINRGINGNRLETTQKGVQELVVRGTGPNVRNRRVEFKVTSL